MHPVGWDAHTHTQTQTPTDAARNLNLATDDTAPCTSPDDLLMSLGGLLASTNDRAPVCPRGGKLVEAHDRTLNHPLACSSTHDRTLNHPLVVPCPNE